MNNVNILGNLATLHADKLEYVETYFKSLKSYTRYVGYAASNFLFLVRKLRFPEEPIDEVIQGHFKTILHDITRGKGNISLPHEEFLGHAIVLRITRDSLENCVTAERSWTPLVEVGKMFRGEKFDREIVACFVESLFCQFKLLVEHAREVMQKNDEDGIVTSSSTRILPRGNY